MKINTTQTLKSLKGENLKTPSGETFTVGEALGNILTSSETGGKFKLFTLAHKIANEDSVDVDGADLRLIKDSVESTKVYSALVSGQLLEILEEKKEVSKKK